MKTQNTENVTQTRARSALPRGRPARGRKPSFPNQELGSASFKLPQDTMILLGVAAIQRGTPRNKLVEEAIRSYLE